MTVSSTETIPNVAQAFRRFQLFQHRVWAFLKTIDAAEAERCWAAGCPRCGGELHSASYPRKPHGLAPALRADARRHSLCCAACRRRVLPPSVRFFGRRFRVAPLFLVVSVLVLSGSVRLEAVGRRWGCRDVYEIRPTTRVSPENVPDNPEVISLR